MNEPLVLSFFITFSRFEYALKATGNAQAGRGDAAEANWQVVVDALQQADAAPVIAKAGILLTEPPRRQVFRNGQLEWQAAGPAGGQAENLAASIKRVRNNLFHGGKYSPTTAELSGRQIRLIASAKAVLDELLNLPALSGIAERFNGYDRQEG